MADTDPREARGGNVAAQGALFPAPVAEDDSILEMSFEELNAERELLMKEARGLAELPSMTLRRLAHIMSRLRTLSSTSKPPKAKKRRTTLDDL